MQILSVSEAKMKLSALIEKVKSSDEEIIITKNGSPAAVLVSPDEFENWKETIAIQSNHTFTEEIQNGLKAYKDGKTNLYTLNELFEDKID